MFISFNMTEINEKELSVWGFTKGLRTGFITFLIAVMMMSIGYLFYTVMKSEREKVAMQKELYELVIKRIDTQLEAPIKNINNVTIKADTAATKAISAANKVDSLSSKIFKSRK